MLKSLNRKAFSTNFETRNFYLIFRYISVVIVPNFKLQFYRYFDRLENIGWVEKKNSQSQQNHFLFVDRYTGKNFMIKFNFSTVELTTIGYQCTYSSTYHKHENKI